MKKSIIVLSLVLLCAATLFLLDCRAEKAQLRENIIRLHVIGNSNSQDDQDQKLRVRDVAIDYLEPLLCGVSSTDEAKRIIFQNIPQLTDILISFLEKEGSYMPVSVSLTESCFDTRYYDTFALPAGVYSSLCIKLGNASGKNWWCVAFPSLCMPAAGRDFRDVAAGAGFSDNLTNSLMAGNKYEVRFFILDLFGRIENFFYKR